MAVQDYKINYKSDFVLNINGDAGWAVPFCIKFWTGMPSQAYFVGFDGVKYVNCRVGDTPTQLLVMFDDHHLPIGKLKMQIAYHTTIEEFPGSVFDEVTNARDVIVTIDGTDYQVMLDFTGEDAPELEFDLPAYANEAERIQNELQRQQNEAARIAAELQREQATAAAVQGAENVNAQLNGTTLTVTNRNGVSTSVNTKGERGEQGPVGPEGPQGEQGPQGVQGLKGETGATGATGATGPQGPTGVSINDFVETGETETDTLYNVVFSDSTTKEVAIPKGEKGDQGPVGPQGPQGPMGDVAVITPEQQAAFTMYSEPGQNTDGPMTQQAVTKKITEDIPIGMVNVEQGTNTGPWTISQEFDVKANDLIRIVVDGNLVKASSLTTKQAYFGVRFTPTGESTNYIYLVCSESGGTASGDLIDYITPLTHKELEYIPQSDGKIDIVHRITEASHFVAEITKISELVYQSAITPTYIQGVVRGRDGVYSGSTTRITTVPIDVDSSQIIKCDLNSAYKYNIVYYDKYGEYVKAWATSGWSQYQYFYINWSGKVAINVAFDDDSSIDASTFSGLTLSLYKKTAIDAEIDTLQQQVDSLTPRKQTYNYLGERIDLNTQSYKTEHCLTMTAYGGSDNRLQSLATYGDIMIIGRHVEVSGGTSYLLYRGNTYLQEVILPHIGYSAIHANTSCFGEASSYTLPLLYTSQWNEERACFVYEINDSYAATLKRVIDPANLDTSIFGAGSADWIVGDGFLYSIAYILDSPYPAAGNGLKVCKFSLPTGNGVITLQDSDILESYEIEPCFVRQDSVYHNGKIYTLFGGDISPYDIYRRMQVLDVCQKKVVTICDMQQWATQEPEAISVKDGVLVFMFNSMSQGLYRFVFD